MTLRLRSFFVTQNFDAAWNCYLDWCAFQQQLDLSHQVELAGCRINGRICWDVRISQALHDARVSGIDTLTGAQLKGTLRPYHWGLFVAVPLAVVGLAGGVWLSSAQQQNPAEIEIQEERPCDRRSRRKLASLAGSASSR